MVPILLEVMSMEVGEHIPKAFEAKFLKNIVDHAREGVLLVLLMRVCPCWSPVGPNKS